MAYIPPHSSSFSSTHHGSGDVHSLGYESGGQNYFHSLEKVLKDHNPELARRFRDKITPQMARKLGDLEKSARELEKSMNEIREMKHEQMERAGAMGGKFDDKIRARIEKMDKMITKTRQSLELNRQSRDDLMDWLLDGEIPSEIRTAEKSSS